MNPLLEKYLRKRGIDSITELNEDEREVYENWESILSETETSSESIKKYCQSQLDMIDGLWENLENSNQKNERLVLLRIVYRGIIKLIETTKNKREEIEAEITALLHKS